MAVEHGRAGSEDYTVLMESNPGGVKMTEYRSLQKQMCCLQFMTVSFCLTCCLLALMYHAKASGCKVNKYTFAFLSFYCRTKSLSKSLQRLKAMKRFFLGRTQWMLKVFETIHPFKTALLLLYNHVMLRFIEYCNMLNWYLVLDML